MTTAPNTTPSLPDSRLRLPHLYGYVLMLFTALVLALLQPVVRAQEAAPLDPPGRVARLSLAEGAVSFAPADEPAGWMAAQFNRPLTGGDRLWTETRARAELHVGSTALRVNGQTSLDFLALDDNLTQLRLAQGSLQLRVRTLFEGQRLEIDTPNLAFVVSQPGNYRLDVSPAGDNTRVVVQSGAGVIYGDGVAPVNLGSQQQISFSGTQLVPGAPGAAWQDGFDAWAAARDRREDASVSARYIPRETIGYQQLDSYGDWSQDPTYGAIWLPRAVPVNWAPYRVGHWSWIAPWGWTWVDDAPWGFAPFHYGRWAQIGPRWAWVPGRLAPRPVYAPALVAFVGGSSGGVNWNISIGSGGAPRPGVGWFPLAPGEAFRPAYRVSPRYITQVNHNIVVDNTLNVTHIYRYQRQPAAVTAVSRDDFAQGRPVRGNLRPVSADDLRHAQVVAERSAMPQRPDRPEGRERPRPLVAAALPPAAVVARPVVSSGGERHDDRRDARPQNSTDARRDNPRTEHPDGQDHPARVQAPAPATPLAAGIMGAQPPAARPGVAPPPVLHPGPAPAQDRNALEAEQRARREQQQAQRDAQRPQAEESPGQRALREQAAKNASVLPANPETRGAADRHALEQAQRAQQQQEQQRRQSEEAQGQRALREQAQKQQLEQVHQQQALQQQQQLQRDQQRQQRDLAQQEQQRRQSEEAQAQRALREQAQKQQLEQAHQQQALQQQQQRAQQEQQRQAHEQQRQQQLQREQAQERQPARQADAANARSARPERPASSPNRPQEQ